jgi:hypothetical protein
MTTLPSGQIIPQAPALHVPQVQDIEGGMLEAASSKTLAANSKLAETAKAMGAGQKGSGRRRKIKRGGATQNLNIHSPMLPSAGTIRGVSVDNVHKSGVDNLNQIRASASGDKLLNAQPYDPTPTKGGRRTKRHRKAKNGRSNKRTHRRGNRKSSHRSGRSRSTLLRSMAKNK